MSQESLFDAILADCALLQKEVAAVMGHAGRDTPESTMIAVYTRGLRTSVQALQEKERKWDNVRSIVSDLIDTQKELASTLDELEDEADKADLVEAHKETLTSLEAIKATLGGV